MKKLTLLILLLFIIPAVSAQSEFKTYQNGLIYDTTTMYHLGVIVDSLNLKFNACDLDHPYYSIPQGRAHYVKVPNAAKKLIEAGISFEDFRKKYPQAIQQQNIYIIKYEYENYEDENVVEYEGLPGAEGPSITLQNTAANNKTSGWVMEDDHAFYLVNLTPTTLPEPYARLIQYVDCMIDTTAQIFLHSAKGDTYQQVDSGSMAHDFIAWAEEFPDRPIYPEYIEDEPEMMDSLWNLYGQRYPAWDSLRLLALDEEYASTPYRQQQLLRARDEAIATGNTDADLEFYVTRYLSKNDALNMKRSRKVYGSCSMDERPRTHAAEICMLAAETYQWDIFLRSHMDIMNDRFERMTDGSYAQAGRKTYLKELEALGINAPDLLLGTCLRAKNVSNNHYYGSIGRIGRALAETNNNDGVEATIFNLLQDDEVDSFNRLLIAYLFSHYNYNLADTVRSTRNEARFKKLRKQLPVEIEQILAVND